MTAEEVAVAIEKLMDNYRAWLESDKRQLEIADKAADIAYRKIAELKKELVALGLTDKDSSLKYAIGGILENEKYMDLRGIE